MSKEIEIMGCIEVPDELASDEVMDAFIDFIKSKGWYFGGGRREITDRRDVPPGNTENSPCDK